MLWIFIIIHCCVIVNDAVPSNNRPTGNCRLKCITVIVFEPVIALAMSEVERVPEIRLREVNFGATDKSLLVPRVEDFALVICLLKQCGCNEQVVSNAVFAIEERCGVAIEGLVVYVRDYLPKPCEQRQ